MTSTVFVPRPAPSRAEIAALDAELLGFAHSLVTAGEWPATGANDSPFGHELCGVCDGTCSFSTMPSPPALVRTAVVLYAGGFTTQARWLLAATMNRHPVALYPVIAAAPVVLAGADLSVLVLADVLAEAAGVQGRSLLEAVRSARKFEQLWRGDVSRYSLEQAADLVVDVVALRDLRERFASNPTGLGVLEALVRDADEITMYNVKAFVETALTF